MADSTLNYGFKKVGPGERLSDDSYQFTDADRDYIDALIHALEVHHHTGALAPTFGQPVGVPGLTLLGSGGTIPAGTRVYYKVSLVDDLGFESASGPEAFVDTASPIGAPAYPALELVVTGGHLLPGNYYYLLTAYYPANTQETQSGPASFIVIPSGTVNEVIIHFPLPPTGAAGYNIYRQGPGEVAYHYIDSVTITGGVTPADYTDTGTNPSANLDRRPPTTNRTQASNSVTVDLPVAATPLPDGWTWKLYRTYVASNYTDSLLHQVVEETFEGSGIITTSYTDVGGGTFRGQPSARSQMRPRPPKLSLANLADVAGRLPLGGLQAFPVVLTFGLVGPVTAQTGKAVWVCEFPRAHIVSARASLGVGATPAAQSVLVDVNKGTGLTPTYTTVFTTQANRPSIAVAGQIGPSKVPDVQDLVQGDSITIDVDQAGGGAGTDHDLTVNVVLLAQFDAATSDWSWS